MARREKPKKTPLSKPFAFRLPVDVAEKYEKIADEMDMKISDVLRKVLCERKYITLKKEDIKLALAMMRTMSKTSNNINQIARHMNNLNIQGKLEYQEFIHYLRILDTIEAQQHLMLQSVENHKKFTEERIRINS